MRNRVKQAWGVSVIGPAHIKRKIKNQDSFLIAKTRKGMVCVVSDGLGSKPYSDIGSKLACKAVVKAIKFYEARSNIQIYDVFLLIQSLWINSVKKYPATQSSATCLFVYINNTSILATSLGDGMVVGVGKKDTDDFILIDEKDDSFANTTDCLTSKNIFSKWKFKLFERNKIQSVFLCTDGISADLEDGMYLPFVKELRKNSLDKNIKQNKIDSYNWLINWPVKGHSDDKTFIFINL